jgi:hypothetical protein
MKAKVCSPSRAALFVILRDGLDLAATIRSEKLNDDFVLMVPYEQQVPTVFAQLAAVVAADPELQAMCKVKGRRKAIKFRPNGCRLLVQPCNES